MIFGNEMDNCLEEWYYKEGIIEGSKLSIDYTDNNIINNIKQSQLNGGYLSDIKYNNENLDFSYKGKIMNLNLQPIFCFKIKTLETDTNFII